MTSRLRNAPAAATVLARHLARGSAHVERLPQPWRNRAYDAALAALWAGDLLDAERLAAAAGPVGTLVRRYVAGELGVLTGPAAAPRTRPTRRTRQPERAGSSERVLHLVTNALPEAVAGYTVRTQGIARAQRAAGHDVHVATRLGFPVTKGHLAAAPEVDVDSVPHHRLLPLRLPLRADAALRRDVAHTARLVERIRPTVLHAHSNHVNAQVALALRAAYGIPVVYEVRGFLEETWRSRSTSPNASSADAYRLARAAETQCLRAADAVVTLSGAMREAIVARGVPVERVHVVPNCVDELFLAAAPWDGGDPVPPGDPESPLSSADGAGSARPVTAGFVGTLNGYEGVDLLVSAVAQLRRAGHDVHLRIVGDGPERLALEKLAADLGIPDATTFTGRVPHDRVVAQHRAIDVYCLPRRDLPVTRLVPPLKPVEAMALGVPVVASDLPPLREIAGDGRGVLVAPDDVGALADAILRLAEAPELRRALGATARAWVVAARTWGAAADTYDDVYALLYTRLHTRIQGEP